MLQLPKVFRTVPPLHVIPLWVKMSNQEVDEQLS